MAHIISNALHFLQAQHTWNTPFKIPRDTSRLKSIVDPRLSDGLGIGAPFLAVTGGVEPGFDLGL